MLYVTVAICVLLIAAALAILPRTRSFAKCLAAGMCGSFPGVFLFQLIAAPFVVIALLMVLLVSEVFSTDANEGVLIGYLLLVIAFFAVASIAGFYIGWRAAWELAAGRSVRQFLCSNWLTKPFMQLLRRVPVLGKVFEHWSV